MIPVTMKQLLSATQEEAEGSLYLNGKELSQVRVLGRVISTKEQSTAMSFILEDGTGKMEVKKWAEDQDDTSGAMSNMFAYVKKYLHWIP